MNIHKLYQTPLEDLLKTMEASKPENPAQKILFEEITRNLRGLVEVGLSYLNLSRKIETLSLGEHQRVRLAGILAQELSGIIYVLDEPSQGLHMSELERLYKSLKRLCERGNTLILVDHDLYFLQNSDWLIDLGPTGGKMEGSYSLSLLQRIGRPIKKNL